MSNSYLIVYSTIELNGRDIFMISIRGGGGGAGGRGVRRATGLVMEDKPESIML